MHAGSRADGRARRSSELQLLIVVCLPPKYSPSIVPHIFLFDLIKTDVLQNCTARQMILLTGLFQVNAISAYRNCTLFKDMFI